MREQEKKKSRSYERMRKKERRKERELRIWKKGERRTIGLSFEKRGS